MKIPLLALVFSAALLGAQTHHPAQTRKPAAAPQVPAVPGLPMYKVPVRTLYSLRAQEIQIGTGALAEPGQVYSVHYTGWLTDGKKFDSSLDRGEPIQFQQGRRMVIAGWDTGFEGMRVGGKRRLYIPYQLAYGEKGKGEIPPKADLIFDVELVDIKPTP